MAKKTLITGGTVYSVEPDTGTVHGGDVLIEGDTIVAVGVGIVDPDAEIIDATGMIVMPGLVDTHRHTWQAALRQVGSDWTLNDYVTLMIGSYAPKFRPEDVRAGNLLGALEAIDSGVTTLMDWSHITNSPEHADAAIEGLRASRIRAVYGYGSPTIPAAPWWADDFRRVAEMHFPDPSGRITLALASSGPEFESFEQAASDIALARAAGVMTSLHVGVGMLAHVRAVTWMDQNGLLGDDLIFIHGNMLTDDELLAIARSGGHVSVSPRIEMQMGHGYPATGRMIAAGLRPSLSLDVVSGVGGNLFADLRAALEAERAEQNRVALSAGQWTMKLEFTVADAIRMATLDGARALGLADQVGSLAVGKQADLIVIAPEYSELSVPSDVEAAIALSDPRTVRHVFVGGEALKLNGELLGHDVGSVREDARASRRHLMGEPLTIDASH